MTKKSWEKELLSALILTGDEPVEVIFSGGVSKTIRVIPWKLFVKHINSLLAKQDGKSYGQGYKEGYADAEYQVKKEIIEKLEKMKREDMESPLESDYKGENYIREIIARENYNDAINQAIKTIKKI